MSRLVSFVYNVGVFLGLIYEPRPGEIGQFHGPDPFAEETTCSTVRIVDVEDGSVLYAYTDDDRDQFSEPAHLFWLSAVALV